MMSYLTIIQKINAVKVEIMMKIRENLAILLGCRNV